MKGPARDDTYYGPAMHSGRATDIGIAGQAPYPGYAGRIGTPVEPEKARTYDDGKEPLAWLPWAAISELAKVQAYGHKKYLDFNNYRKGMEVSRNLSCALRHIKEYMEGHDQDKESGLNPLAHALCRIAFVLQNIADKTHIDDRYKKPAP
jgi:hypothetical protein